MTNHNGDTDNGKNVNEYASDNDNDDNSSMNDDESDVAA